MSQSQSIPKSTKRANGQPEMGKPAPVAHIQPPGYMKNNPDCPCGWKLKRIYSLVQVKTSHSKRKYRSKQSPIGWACFKCGYTELDQFIGDPVYFSRIREIALRQAELKTLLEANR